MSASELTIKELSYRKIKSIDLDAFKSDLRNSALFKDTPLSLGALVTSYNETLTSLLDKHAPLRSRTVITRPRVPWLTDEIRESKRLRRRAERKWRSSGLEADFANFKLIKNRTTHVMNKARRDFYTDFINKNSDNQRKLFAATRKLLSKSPESPFPPHTTNKLALANDIGAYFVKKIANIRADLDSAPISATVLPNTVESSVHQFSVCQSHFHEFEALDEDSVRKLVLSAPTKSCPLDPVPTSIVKDCI